MEAQPAGHRSDHGRVALPLKVGLTLGGALSVGSSAFTGSWQTRCTPETIQGILTLMSYAPALFGIVGVILMLFYPLTNAMMEKIEVDLTARRAQEAAV
jgi:Na+/melibiose symporter-like transporter